jgi:cytochrome b
MNKILVWDLPVRVGHWLLAATFMVAWLTAESETWRLVHVGAGYAMAALILFRLVWGLVGSRYARFASFVSSPRAALDYLRGLVSGRGQHWIGHNPAGGYAILALLGLGLLSAGSGWLTYQDFGEWAEELHEALASAMLAAVGIHLIGVLVGSLAHRENLVASMVNGRKRGEPGKAIARPWGWAVLLQLLVAGAAAVYLTRL